MHPAVTLLLSAAADDHLSRIVDQVGGFDRARHVIFEEADELQSSGNRADFAAVISLFSKVEKLARRML
jgi:hypothetical protein